MACRASIKRGRPTVMPCFDCQGRETNAPPNWVEGHRISSKTTANQRLDSPDDEVDYNLYHVQPGQNRCNLSPMVQMLG